MTKNTEQDLQQEFRELVKEISKEVLELDVVKSIGNYSNTIKTQVPMVSSSINELSNEVSKLSWISNELAKYKQEQVSRNIDIDDKLQVIETNVETEIKNIILLQELIIKNQKNIEAEFISQQTQINNALNVYADEVKEVVNQITVLSNKSLSNSKSTKKILSILLFAIYGMLGGFTYLFLKSIGII